MWHHIDGVHILLILVKLVRGATQGFTNFGFEGATVIGPSIIRIFETEQGVVTFEVSV
jgi:hypothetical protein